MKRILTICFLLALVASAVAQQQSVMTNFGGMSGSAQTDVTPGMAVDVVNFDFRTSAVTPGVSLILRDGYRYIGDVQAGLTSGPWVFSSPTISRQLLAAFGRELLMYDLGGDVWVNAGINPLADTCSCTTGNDTVLSVYNKNWWAYSVEDYDSISIGGNIYGIEKIMGDSMVILDPQDSLPTYTDAAIPCTLNVIGTVSSSNLFTDPQANKYALMFEDTLHIITPDEKIKYGGSNPVAVATPLEFDSIGAWNDDKLTITLYGAQGSNGWIQIGPEHNYNLNIALYSVAKTGNSNTVRCDTAVAKWLIDNPDSSWLMKPIATPVWDTLFECTVSTVAVESTFAYNEVYGNTTLFARVLLGPTYTSHAYLTSSPKTYRPVYIYRWKISATSVAGAPSTWPLDSLTYMTVYADNQSQANGLYTGQIPVTMDTLDAGDTCFLVTTIGYPGGSETSFDTAAYFKPFWQTTTGTSCDSTATACPFPDYNGPWLTNVVAGGTATWVNYSQISWCGSYVNNCYVQCVTTYTPFTLNDNGSGAATAYQASDSLVLTNMLRGDRTPLGSGTVRDTVQIGVSKVPWSWGYCISALGRFFCIDQDTAKNTVYWSAPNNPDSFGVADFENVFPDDGQTISTLAAEQNVIYVFSATGIYIMPMSISDDGVTLDPTGIFPTRAKYGPLTPRGLVKTPMGWYFIGYPGVFQFDGSNATLMSQEMNWFWRDSLLSSQISSGSIEYDTHRDRLLVSLPRANTTANDITLVYDFTTGQWARYDFGAHHFAMLSYPSNEPRLYWANPDVTAGRVYRMDPGLKRDLDMQMTAYFRTGQMLLGTVLGDRGQLGEWFVEGWWDQYAHVALLVYLDGDTTVAFADTIPSGTGGWQVNRMAFPVGLGGHHAQIMLRVTDADTCNVTGLRIDITPEGTVDQE